MCTDNETRINGELVRAWKRIAEDEPEKYLSDYTYITLEYAFTLADLKCYEKMTSVLNESINCMIRIKKQYPCQLLEKENIKEMISGYHELMIELAEKRYYDQATEIHDLLADMLEVYQMKVEKK